MTTLLRRLISSIKPSPSCSSFSDPDVTVTAATGPLGLSLSTYKLHRSLLMAHSHYFKQCLQNPTSNDGMIICALPVTDANRVFPCLVKYMYEGRLEVDEENYVHVCWLALKLGMAQVHLTPSLIQINSM
jgi:hypothetical protein